MTKLQVRSRLALAALFLLLPVLPFGPATTWAQGHTWARSYGGGLGEGAWTIQQTSDGGFAVAGWTWSFGAGDSDIWILKLRADGTIQWQRTYGGYDDDAADLIYQASDGGYVVTGYTASYGAGAIDVWLLKLGADGAVQWQKTYGGRAEDEAVGIQQTLDGGYIVAGETDSFGAGDWDVWLLKLGADGAVQWQKTYGGPRSETTSADPVQQTADGGYIVTGRTASFGAGGYDVWMLKLDENGTVQWQKTYGGPGDDEAHAVRQTLNGGYVVAGYTASFGAGATDIWVIKLDGQGTILWQKTFGGEGTDLTFSVHPTFDGGCVVGGYTWSFGAGASDFWVLKLSQNGTLQWQKTYGGPARDEAASIRQTSEGGYVVAGGTESFAGGWDFWVLRLGADGDIPGCPLVAISGAIVGDTAVVGVDSNASVSSSACTIKNTYASSPVSWGSLHTQCEHRSTPTPTASCTPSHTTTRTATTTATPGFMPTGTPRHVYLPIIVRFGVPSMSGATQAPGMASAGSSASGGALRVKVRACPFADACRMVALAAAKATAAT